MKIKKKVILGLSILAINSVIFIPNSAKKSISDLSVTKSYAIEDLKELEKQVEAARVKRDQAKIDYQLIDKNVENVLGFFNWVKYNYPNEKNDLEDAIRILNAYPANTDYTDPEDASSIKNIKRSLEILLDTNLKRTSDKNFENLNPLYTSHRMLAMAISNANNSLDIYQGHLRHFNVGENLAWGYDDPNFGWYTEELEIYNENKDPEDEEVGHYLNIVDNYYYVTGLALNTKPVSEYDSIWSQVFDSEGIDKTYYTIDQYLELIYEYESSDKANDLEKAYYEAEENHNILKEKLENSRVEVENLIDKSDNSFVEVENTIDESEYSLEEVSNSKDYSEASKKELLKIKDNSEYLLEEVSSSKDYSEASKEELLKAKEDSEYSLEKAPNSKDYFKASKEELLKTIDEYGYSLEEVSNIKDYAEVSKEELLKTKDYSKILLEEVSNIKDYSEILKEQVKNLKDGLEKHTEEKIREVIENIKEKLVGIYYTNIEMSGSVKRNQYRFDRLSERDKKYLLQVEEYIGSIY